MTPAWAEVALHLRVLVALCPSPDGGAPAPVQPTSWVQEHIAAAQTVIGPLGVVFLPEIATFTPRSCTALTRAERDAFAAHVTDDGPPTVLVVARVRDLDVPDYDLMGVHWRARGRHWVFLTARARPPTLAHELAHYFGLPHDPAGGNLMTPGPSSPLWRSPRPPRPFAPVLTPAQARRLRAAIAGAP